MGSVSQDDRGSGTPYDLTHNDEGRLVEIAQGLTTLASYKHNAFGQRVVKTAGATTTHYHYDDAGRLIAESNGSGTVQREFIHLGSLPLAVVDHTVGGGPALYHVHADHLGTPRVMTDGSKTVVWDAVFRPFGELESLTGTATNDNRFQGQRLDAVAGFHYNYFRDYDPRLGRYIQSDPIGLAGGINTYAYVHSDPIGLVDPKGLESIFGSGGIGANECDATAEEALVAAGVTLSPFLCAIRPDLCARATAGLEKTLSREALRRAIREIGEQLGELLKDESGTIPRQARNNNQSKRHTPDQRAAVELAKEARRRGGLSQDEAEALVDMAKETGLEARGPESHPGRPYGQEPHIHVGPINHIPVK